MTVVAVRTSNPWIRRSFLNMACLPCYSRTWLRDRRSHFHGNVTLMQQLADALPGMRVASTQTLGLDPDWVEALAFAWLAKQTLEGKPGNLPSVTGARASVVLGGIYLGNL